MPPWRVRSSGSRLLIAEVHSRIDDFSAFEGSISAVGFVKKAEDLSNKMFVLYEFARTEGRAWGVAERERLRTSTAELKPCIYKRR